MGDKHRQLGCIFSASNDVKLNSLKFTMLCNSILGFIGSSLWSIQPLLFRAMKHGHHGKKHKTNFNSMTFRFKQQKHLEFLKTFFFSLVMTQQKQSFLWHLSDLKEIARAAARLPRAAPGP